MSNGNSNLLQITINGRCDTHPKAPTMKPSGYNQVQWQAPNGTFTLHLPGGVFVGQQQPFRLDISGPQWQPSTALQLVDPATPQTISNYVYEGDNPCVRATEDTPPEIVIDS